MQCDRRDVLSVSRAYTLMKDLVDSPALSMGPAELEAAAIAIGMTSLTFLQFMGRFNWCILKVTWHHLKVF